MEADIATQRETDNTVTLINIHIFIPCNKYSEGICQILPQFVRLQVEEG